MSAALPEFVDRLILDGTKVGWYPERIAAWQRGEKIAPVTIDCAMTRACNAACSFCAPPGQEVLMESGAKIPIEQVPLGARVISAERWGCKVVGTMSRLVNEDVVRVVVGRASCLITKEHPVFTRAGYRKTDGLIPGDEVGLCVVDGATDQFFSPVTSIERFNYAGPVYNLAVDGNNSYVLGGIGVHNCYASLQASEGEKITKECFFDFLDDAAAIGVRGVSFISDGESTVVPWYADAVEHAAGLGLQVGAGSNGIKLTRPIMERILPHLSYLRINFSAGERAAYARIMGVPQHNYDDVIQNVRDGMEIIHRDKLGCTLNLQLVLHPRDADQIIPFAKLSCELMPVYSVIKHCADNKHGHLGVDYSQYPALYETLKEAEAMGKRAGLRLTVKWDRITGGGKRNYTQCYGTPFLLQMSGNGLIAPCGFLFGEEHKKMHIGNIVRQRFRDIWGGDRYKEVIDYLASEHWNSKERCGPGCLQNPTNEFLFALKEGRVSLPVGEAPPHLGFL